MSRLQSAEDCIVLARADLLLALRDADYERRERYSRCSNNRRVYCKTWTRCKVRLRLTRGRND